MTGKTIKVLSQRQKIVSSHTELSSNTRVLIKHNWSAFLISFCVEKEFGGGMLLKVLNSLMSLPPVKLKQKFTPFHLYTTFAPTCRSRKINTFKTTGRSVCHRLIFKYITMQSEYLMKGASLTKSFTLASCMTMRMMMKQRLVEMKN